MPYPDGGKEKPENKWDTTIIFIVVVVIFNMIIVTNLVMGGIYPSFKNTGFYKFFFSGKVTDDSADCRYDGDCS